MDFFKIKTLGELKKSGYQTKSIKQELRDNLISKIKNDAEVFQGVFGYEDTVVPELQRAILSKHHINLLGLRGQAKTRLARLMINLLDEYIPVVEGSELNDDPFRPISRYSVDLIEKHGDDTPISWLHRSDRYTEKLATPDVSVADLIGDVDPIKAATLKLPYSDERVIHYGLIPRSHRCLFVINELPDLQARIQVSLFNILQEGDIQIRGFKLRLPLDIQFIFTANPEDYTNRGSIITPLKDRIDSQIITHYPKTREISKQISEQEINRSVGQSVVKLSPVLVDLCEQIAIEARQSEFVDQKSGVSARMTIAMMESLIAACELRVLKNSENSSYARISDLWNVVPAITGKIELVYEGEQEGALIVAQNLIGKAIRTVFNEHFTDPETEKKSKKNSIYQSTIDWFREGNNIEVGSFEKEEDFRNKLYQVPGLFELVNEKISSKDKDESFVFMELVLFGLAEHSLISRQSNDGRFQFKDLLDSMFKGFSDEDFDENDN